MQYIAQFMVIEDGRFHGFLHHTYQAFSAGHALRFAYTVKNKYNEINAYRKRYVYIHTISRDEEAVTQCLI